MKLKLIFVLMMLGWIEFARADGSIMFIDADRFLKQQPALRSYLLKTLCISSTGLAVRVAGNYPMGGARIGPYKLMAKPKGQLGPYTMMLHVNTVQYFYDKQGKDADVTEAVRIKEILDSVEISELKEPEEYWPSYNCK